MMQIVKNIVFSLAKRQLWWGKNKKYVNTENDFGVITAFFFENTFNWLKKT